ncbi:MAG: hypothetical protein OCD76_23340 [Reichenbachiella sp.]
MRKYLLILLIAALSSPLVAQETPVEDPFADYSYLWAKPVKEKKKKKKKNSDQPQQSISESNSEEVQQEDVFIAEEVPVALDTPRTEDNIELVTSDSTITEELPVEVVAVGTMNLDSLQQVEQMQDSIKNAENLAKRKERNEKNEDKEPVEDFRAGMPAQNAGSSINAGFTYTVIDGKSYAGLVIAPELNFGKVGVGLDIPILYGIDDQSIRTEMFEDGVGVLRLIQYVRLGRQKVDPIYVRLGVLSGTMVGYGGLINNYSNSTSYEKRKFGLHYDINYKGIAGIEGLYSDFNPTSLNLLAIRPYVRPLSWTGIPIIRSLEIGGTIIQDKDQTEILGFPEENNTYKFTKEGVGAYGFDMGMTLLRVPFIQIDLFAGYSFLDMQTTALNDSIDALNAAAILDITSDDFKNGTGGSIGFNFRFHFIADLLSADLRIERLRYSDYFTPQFFDTSYEINKDARILTLAGAEKQSGTYGSLTAHILNKVQIGGSLMYPDNPSVTSPAVVTLTADLDRLADKISIHAKYYKGNLASLEDAFTLDENSLAKMRFVYHMNKFLVVGVDYYWAFTPTETGFTTTQTIMPYFGLSIKF